MLDLGLAKNLEKYAIFDQIEEYHNILNKSKTKIVVILHSIDGPQLMNPDSQEKLSCLFDNPFIQLICSLDSMKMVMNWSPSKSALTQLLFKSTNFSSSMLTLDSLTSNSCVTDL